ncbi:unnamed protein product [Moneuplotes crassus]|uniref:DUSP domain-containing protein n=1 Tax=Euplotes crassus TaxID=5936 RepID=A0AAD1Y9T2_EUPCR|nr:unnamed protein product [Moneuplotes crassus]
MEGKALNLNETSCLSTGDLLLDLDSSCLEKSPFKCIRASERDCSSVEKSPFNYNPSKATPSKKVESIKMQPKLGVDIKKFRPKCDAQESKNDPCMLSTESMIQKYMMKFKKSCMGMFNADLEDIRGRLNNFTEMQNSIETMTSTIHKLEKRVEELESKNEEATNQNASLLSKLNNSRLFHASHLNSVDTQVTHLKDSRSRSLMADLSVRQASNFSGVNESAEREKLRDSVVSTSPMSRLNKRYKKTSQSTIKPLVNNSIVNHDTRNVQLQSTPKKYECIEKKFCTQSMSSEHVSSISMELESNLDKMSDQDITEVKNSFGETNRNLVYKAVNKRRQINFVNSSVHESSESEDEDFLAYCKPYDPYCPCHPRIATTDFEPNYESNVTDTQYELSDKIESNDDGNFEPQDESCNMNTVDINLEKMHKRKVSTTKNNKNLVVRSQKCGKLCRYLPAEEQLNILKGVSSFKGAACSEKYNYAISSDWWNQFCDFINIEFKDPKDIFSPAHESDMYRIYLESDNCLTPSLESMSREPAKESEEEKEPAKFTFNHEELYKRPGMITNIDIARWRDGIITLKPNLRMIHDYVKVSQQQFNYLSKWYGYDLKVIISPLDSEYGTVKSKAARRRRSLY